MRFDPGNTDLRCCAARVKRTVLTAAAVWMFAGAAHAQMAAEMQARVRETTPSSMVAGSEASAFAATTNAANAATDASSVAAVAATPAGASEETASVRHAGLPSAPQAKKTKWYTKPTEKPGDQLFVRRLGTFADGDVSTVPGINQAEGVPHEWGGGMGGTLADLGRIAELAR
jgi:hypothetical protein